MDSRKKDLLALLLIFLIGFWGIWGLWKFAGLPTSHDSISHMTRLYAYIEGLKDGNFPVLWGRRMYWGIGSPVLMLNYQIPYYFTLIWHYIGFNLDNSFKLTLSFAHIASGILMYGALRIRYKQFPALVGAVLYIVAPYRFLNIFVRGALGEVFAVMFPPIILAGIWRKSTILQTVGWAGLFLSHPVGSAFYSAIMFGYVLIDNQFRNIWNILKRFFIPYGLALMIAAFNLFPALALTKYTYYKTENSDTLHHFPTFRQLVYQNWGYGFSTTDDKDEMSFQIGLIQWFVAGVAITTILSKPKKLFLQKNRELIFLFFVFAMAILLMLQKFATPIYVYLGLTHIIDYPWRLLMVFGFLTALMSVSLVDRIKLYKWKVIFGMFLICGAIYTNRNHIRINLIWPWPSSTYIRYTGDAFGEYAAKYRNTRDGSEFEYMAKFIKGGGKIAITKDKSREMEIIVDADESSIIRLESMYFPGWVARVNDQEVPIFVSKITSENQSGCFVTSGGEINIDTSGLVACYVPAGNTKIDLRYESLPIQRVANLVTLVGIGAFIWILLRSFCRRSTKPKR